jgi:hypothetical protein
MRVVVTDNGQPHKITVTGKNKIKLIVRPDTNTTRYLYLVKAEK